MYTTLNLSHAEAQEMIDAVRRRLEAEKKAGAIAVTDSHGELIAFLRMDGCHLPPVQIAINKAFTASRERRPSGAVGEASRTAPFPMTNYGDFRYTGWAGGLPVLPDRQRGAEQRPLTFISHIAFISNNAYVHDRGEPS